MRMTASTVSSLSPTSSTVSIMPGIDTAAPDRTETNKGRRVDPSCRPVAASSSSIPAANACVIAAAAPAGERRHHVVGRTKAAGTGRFACTRRIKFQALFPTSAAPPCGSAAPGRMA